MITGRVYFIQLGEDGPIKIGFTRNVPKRLSTLQTGQPIKLRVLTDCPGSKGHEQEFHKACAAHRLEGEWFSPHADVMLAAKAAQLYAFGYGEEVTEEIETLARAVVENYEPTDSYGRCLKERLWQYIET